MQNFNRVFDQLSCFRNAGGHVAIDDFGTGMSSLSYLLEFPHDRIKIDRSFIRRLGNGDASSERLTRMIIDLGLSLDKIVIAEGVETIDQAAWLLDHGCLQAQGWLYSRALTLNDFIVFGR